MTPWFRHRLSMRFRNDLVDNSLVRTLQMNKCGHGLHSVELLRSGELQDALGTCLTAAGDNRSDYETE